MEIGKITASRSYLTSGTHIKLIIGHEAVANTGFIQQILGLIGVTLEFLAQQTHVDPQILDVIGVVRPPHLRQNRLMCQHPTGTCGEIGQQFEFGRREFYFFATARNDVTSQIDRDRAGEEFADGASASNLAAYYNLTLQACRFGGAVLSLRGCSP